MKIKSVQLKNYRCFKDLTIEFHDHLTVLVGNNGAGKTAILEAIVVALGTFFMKMDEPSSKNIQKKDVRLEAFEIENTIDVQPQYPTEIMATGEVGGQDIRWKRGLNSAKGKPTSGDAREMTEISAEYQEQMRAGNVNLVLPMLAYYGTGRLWDYHKEKSTDTFKTSTRTNGYIDCLDGTANIKLMMNWFKKQEIQFAQKNAAGFNASIQLPTVYQAMAACYERVSGQNNVNVSYNLDTNEIDFFYKDKDGNGMRIPLSQMSDGYKCTLSLIADIAYRMAVLNPMLGTSILTETDGVVLIDEVDLHLHPGWQHHILSDLREIFPKIQFIVTTHAPAVISSTKSENLLLLSDYDIENTSFESFGNDVNSILTDIMGVSERNPEIAAQFDEFYRLMNARDFDKAEEILDQIDEKRNFHDETIVAQRVKLKLERIRTKKND